MNETQKKSWILWLGWSAAAVLLIVGLAVNEGEKTSLAIIIGLAPLIGAQLALGSPTMLATVRQWLSGTKRPLMHTSGGIVTLYLIASLLNGRFNPYTAVIFGVGSFAALGALRQIGRTQSALTWTDIAIWLLLWIPFDLRWNYELWVGPDGFSYNWWAIMLSVTAVLGWGVFRGWPEFGYRLVPRWRDIGVTLGLTLIFFIIVVPIGLGIDFLTFPPTTTLTVTAVLAHAIGLLLTVAIPEELFFRGILLHGLDKMMSKRWLAMLISAAAFGLMHWNNANDLTTQIAYTALATLAGVFYGLAYRRTGNNLLAAVLLHTLVDLIWQFAFQ